MYLQEYLDRTALLLDNPNDFVLKQAIKLDVIAARAKLIRDQFTNTHTFPVSAIIPLKCLALEEVPSTMCCSIDLGCTVLRSVEKIPRPIDVKDTVNFNFVGSVDFTSEWGWLKPEEISRIKYRKWSSNEIYYTWLDDYIIVLNTLSPKAFSMRYPIANLIEAERLRNCYGEQCLPLEQTVIVEDHWIEPIDKMIFAKYRKPLVDKQIKVDEDEES